MATATKTRTLGVTCPFCLSGDEAVTLNLNDLAECRCSGCDETFSPAEAEAKFAELAERWAKVAAWVSAAPTA